MSCWTKEELENMLEDVINALDLTPEIIEKYAPLGTPPAQLVKLALEEKIRQIFLLKRGFKEVQP